MTDGPLDPRVLAAHERAVRREYEAIDVHESAARLHDERAARLGDAAEAQEERGRAAAARERAEHARQRLREEGLDPQAPPPALPPGEDRGYAERTAQLHERHEQLARRLADVGELGAGVRERDRPTG